jgi:hypothetical protein
MGECNLIFETGFLYGFWCRAMNKVWEAKPQNIFSSRTLVAKALKVVFNPERAGFQKFANFLHIPKFNLPDHPKQSCHFIFHFFNLLSQILNFHDDFNLEKKMS